MKATITDAVWNYVWNIWNTPEIPPVPPATEPTPKVQLIPVIFEYEDGVRPTTTYLTISNLKNARQKGTSWKSLVYDVLDSQNHEQIGKQDIYFNLDFDVEVNALGAGGYDCLIDLIQSLDLESALDYFTSKKLVIRDISVIQELTGVVENNSLERYMLELTMGCSLTHTEAMQWVKTVEYDETFQHES